MIRVYDFEYRLLGETEYAISSEWDIKFNAFGSYEGSFDINSDFTSIFAQNKYLIICDGENQAICVGQKISDRLTVYGRTPEWLLSKRVVMPFKTSEIFGSESFTDPESIIFYLLNRAYKEPCVIDEEGNVGSEINSDAVCSELVLPEKIGVEKLNRHFWRSSAKTLYEVIRDLCELIGCGHRLKFNPKDKCWEFSLQFGKKREALISKSLKNAYDMSLTGSLLDNADAGVFKSDGESEEPAEYGYIKNTDIRRKGMLYWERLFPSATCLSEAEALIKKAVDEEDIDCEIMGITYGEDYCLGDELRVQFEAGAFRTTLRLFVSGVNIISSHDGRIVKPIFSKI